MSDSFLSEQLSKVQELKALIKQSFQPMPAAPAPGGAPTPAQGAAPAPAQGAAPQVDPNTGMQIDPNTGLLIDPASGMLIDPASGQMIDPATGQPVQGGPPAPGAPPAPAQDPAAAGAPGTPPPIPDELVQALEEMSAALNQLGQKQAEQEELIASMQDEHKRLKAEIQDAQDLAYDAMKEVRKSRLA